MKNVISGVDMASEEAKHVEAYRTSDGKFFEDPEEARKHQDDINLGKNLRSFAERHGYYGMGTRDLGDLLFEHRDELREILRDTQTEEES